MSTRGGPIWVGTLGGGANIVDPATGQVRQLPHGTEQAGAISASIVTSIVEDERLRVDWHRRGWAEPRSRRRHGREGIPARSQGRTHVTGELGVLACDGQRRSGVGRHEWRWTGPGRRLGATPDAIRFELVSRADGLSNDTVYGIVPAASGISGSAATLDWRD